MCNMVLEQERGDMQTPTGTEHPQRVGGVCTPPEYGLLRGWNSLSTPSVYGLGRGNGIRIYL